MHDDSSVPEPSGPRRLSPLAVVAVVLAAIPMCVPVNLLGFVFGVLALRRIRLSAGMWRGVGVARTAVVLGMVTTLGGSWGWMALQEWQESVTTEAAARAANGFVLAPAANDPSAALEWWSPQAGPPSVEALTTFGKALAAGGAVSHVTVNAVTPTMDGDFLQPTLSLWLTIVCSDGQQWRSAARLNLVPSPGELTPQGRLRWIEVDLPSGQIAVGQRPTAAEEGATP